MELQSYNLFISSPNDVKEERKIAEDVVHRISFNCKDVLRISFEIIKWENLPPTKAQKEEQIQDIINKEVEKANFFLLILNKRYGTVSPGHSISNTERELNTILKRYEKNPQLKILAYFKKLDPNPDPGLQEKKVREFRERLSKIGIFYKEYEDLDKFRTELTHDLYNIVMRMKLSTYKHFVLNKFWQFGEPDRPTFPRVAIIYPPVNRNYMDPMKQQDFWIKRLTPNLYFEDYKALNKLEKQFNMIGLFDYKIYTQYDTPIDMKFMNKIWICLPRLPQGIKALNKYKEILRFEFFPKGKRRKSQIVWKCNDGTKIAIKSPLRIYLKEQRKNLRIDGEWNKDLSGIVAKDYSVLARLIDDKSVVFTKEGSGGLREYFIAGISGLGTWGATWYLDRKYKELKDIEEDEPIQLLLETTYQDGKIIEVKNVSDEKANYFKEQQRISTIRKEISNYLAKL